MVDGEPLDSPRAKALILRIVEDGNVTLSRHAREELAKDKMDMGDVMNVLRAGRVEPGEVERGTYRYRVRTPRMTAVVAFRSETELRIVTGWREKTR